MKGKRIICTLGVYNVSVLAKFKIALENKILKRHWYGILVYTRLTTEQSVSMAEE